MKRRAFNPDSLPPASGYSQVVQVSGGTSVFIAGQVAMDVEGRLVGDGDFETQTRQVFSNLLAALSEAGAEVSDLVKIGIYVVDHSPEKLGVVRQVRDEILGDDPPVSTLLGVDRLAFPGLMIEVDAVAVID